ncbi:Formyl-coenzyme A transferase [Achromobacter xylosoxidans]|nr:Formyl-coenzyme A transferase [Achromobacter xylosoxidans]
MRDGGPRGPAGRPALYRHQRARARNQDALREILEAIFADADAPTWLARFRAAGVPCAPINTYSEVLADPQVEHMGWVQPLELPNGVRTRTFGLPVRFDGQTTALRRPPPALGEHNDAVLGPLRNKGKGA